MAAFAIHACKELIIMSAPKKHRFLKLMRMEQVSPAHIKREKLADSSPRELLALLSFSEFLQLKEEIKASSYAGSLPPSHG